MGPAPKLSQIFAINVHVGCRRPVYWGSSLASPSVIVIPKMVARCALFNISTMKTVFSLSMMVTIGRHLDVDN